MRQHGKANISATSPRALGVCDRCGALYNHNQLRWQHDWRGPQLQNLRILVCESCYDRPQQNGQRTIILPADPIPIMNARPEAYIADNNPLSGIGYSPSGWQYGAFIGSMTEGGGVPSAFDGNTNKPSWMSAVKSVSDSSYVNYVGVNWSEKPVLLSPSSLNSPVLTHTLLDWVITAPNDSTFGSTSYLIQGSNVGGSAFSGWTTISSGNPSGTIGEEISGDGGGSRYQFHRVALWGNGTSAVAVAQAQFSVAERSSNGGTA